MVNLNQFFKIFYHIYWITYEYVVSYNVRYFTLTPCSSFLCSTHSTYFHTSVCSLKLKTNYENNYVKNASSIITFIKGYWKNHFDRIRLDTSHL